MSLEEYWEKIKEQLQKICRDSIPVKINPIATKGLIISFFVIFSIQYVYPDLYQIMFLLLALNPASLRYIYTLYQLVTHIFLHADPMHLLVNSAFLYMVGDNVEEKLGSKYYLIAFFVCGVFAALGFTTWIIYFFPLMSDIACVGSSGAIAGIMAIYLLLVPENDFIILNQYTVKSTYFISAWFIEQVFYTFFFIQPSGIAYAAHVSGFITGLIIGWITKSYKKEQM
jgi:membrane associated rhomboid family serine protease